MSENHDLDVLAYIDGLLDDDPARKANVESRLQGSPELASRVRAYEAQNRALRLAYNGRLHEPVPETLLAALDGDTRYRGWTLARAAAVACMVVSASLLGWLVGRSHQPASEPPSEFVERSYREFAGAGGEAAMLAGATQSQGGIEADRVSLSLKIPDLSSLGYALVDRESISSGEQRMVRLTYAGPDGQGFSLFLHPRMDAHKRDLELTTKRGVSLAYWVEGALATAVASDLPSDQTMAIARKVRKALADPSLSQPTMQTVPGQKSELVTGLPESPAGADNPVLAPSPAPQNSYAIPN